MTVPTLRGRLALTAVVTTAVCVGLLTVGFNLLLSSQLHAQAGDLLRERAAAAAATVSVAADGSVHVLDPIADAALDADLWVYAGHTPLERPHAGPTVQAQADALAQRGERFASIEEPRPRRLFALPVMSHGRQVGTIVSAVSLDSYRNVARLALVGSVGLGLLLLAGAYALTRVLVARALAPVQRMSTQAAQWSDAGAAERFGAAARPRELAVLAHNLDGVLDRQAGLLRHEQQVTEEISHELRTPLSLVTAETDLLQARRRTRPELDAALSRISSAATSMNDILETLLTTARSRSLSAAGRCRLAPVLHAAAERAPGEVHVELVDPELMAGVDGAVVERIVAPLLDNAARYARSRVEVEVTAEPPYVVIRVRDDGPGVDPALGDAAFEPGRRTPDEHGGAGLGLALARRLARATGGDIVLAAGCFEIRLPGA